MNADSRSKVEVDVPPARAKQSRFRPIRLFFGGVILLFTALGLWKAYELIVAGLSWYEQRRSLVNAVLVLIALAIFVGTLVFVVNTFRARREPDLPVFETPKPSKSPKASNVARKEERDRGVALMPADGDVDHDQFLDSGRKSAKPLTSESPRASRKGDARDL